jgi:hypothetical protein
MHVSVVCCLNGGEMGEDWGFEGEIGGIGSKLVCVGGSDASMSLRLLFCVLLEICDDATSLFPWDLSMDPF